jgi:hypothetical protein
MDEIYKDGDNKTPIIYVLSQGSDPNSIFVRFAKKIQGNSEAGWRIISLG